MEAEQHSNGKQLGQGTGEPQEKKSQRYRYVGELPSEGAPVASGSGGRSMQGGEAERGSDWRHRGDFPSMTLRSESEGKRRGKGQNETPDV